MVGALAAAAVGLMPVTALADIGAAPTGRDFGPARRRVRSSDGWLHRLAQPGHASGVRWLGWNDLRLMMALEAEREMSI